ncbi:hypothetical protein ACLOJK_009770 [Asimina triloba]
MRNRMNLPSPQQSRMSDGHPNRLRTKKKHKRLDAIRDHVIEPAKPDVGGRGARSSDAGFLRRSSRLRRPPPAFPDLYPSPSRKRQNVGSTSSVANKQGEGSVERKGGKRKRESPSEKVIVSPDSEGLKEAGSWSSRLRSRDRNAETPVKGKGSPAKRKLFHKLDGGREEDRKWADGVAGSVSKRRMLRSTGRGKKSEGAASEDQTAAVLSDTGGESSDCPLKDWLSPKKADAALPFKNAIDAGSEEAADESSLQRIDQGETKNVHDLDATEQGNDQLRVLSSEPDNGKSDADGDGLAEATMNTDRGERAKVTVDSAVDNSNHLNPLEGSSGQNQHDDLATKPLQDNIFANMDEANHVSNDANTDRPCVREGRRCGLCGGGTDGKPPKRLVQDPTDSDNEVYGGSSASDEPNYDIWDGFGDEPGWLGHLLGPIHDRFGIAGVWVHQHCAVWSPEVWFGDFHSFHYYALYASDICMKTCDESVHANCIVYLSLKRSSKVIINSCIRGLFSLLAQNVAQKAKQKRNKILKDCIIFQPYFLVYFAGLGCLKNVRAALCRGRALKCSRCGRPGATIGCRVDRCPKTYHLVTNQISPCGRAEGCIFDHRKFLIACTDHRHLFQPQGYHYLRRLKKVKAKKMRFDMRKVANDSWRKDVEAEEKWLENCGEDEEFLRREGKRLHRDIARIAPVYIGGSSSDGEKTYQGWESVAGLKDVIQCMKEVVILPLLYPELFVSLGLTPPRGVLLHGYPGTGKTLVVRALIGACSRGDKRIAYFARKGADCLGKYVGDAERQLRLLFQVAERSQPSIIFFDEIDGLAPRRSRQQDQTHSSVVSTLLALMDGLKSRGSVIVIGATNQPDAVDPALRRPGRFDREIYFPLPSVKDRSAILSLHTKRWPKPLSGSLLTWIAEQTCGFAGADLQALCTQAAMIALKRSCALQELLYAAEKYPNHGKRVSLPSFAVEERDWLAALACVPPPCSRREAGMAANEVVSSPLPAHLVTCLLQPLLHLLITLYLDERIGLPPSLHRAAKATNAVIISALEQKKLPVASWFTHLPLLIQEPNISREVERALSSAGLLTITSFSSSGQLEDDDNGFDAGACGQSTLRQNLSYPQGNAPGFRVLVAGSPRSGQQHLAACLLHGFAGHVELQKVNLATISQEGHGDIFQGITHILCISCTVWDLMTDMGLSRCIIYMPRIDLWAIDDAFHQDTGSAEEGVVCQKICKSDLENGSRDVIEKTSRAWNSFMEQVDCLCTSASLMILATCELPDHIIPLRIRQFFTTDVLNCSNLAPLQFSIPRYLVPVDGKFKRDIVINYSAVKLSWDIVQLYVQLVHHRSHMNKPFKERKTFEAVESNLEVENYTKENGANGDMKDAPVDSGSPHSVENLCSESQNPNDRNDNKKLPTTSETNLPEDEGCVQSCKKSFLVVPHNRNGKGKSTLLLAIANFGYQILRYPHFAELCWATSKLKEGPHTNVNGRLKGWPFNSCIIRPNNLAVKESVGCPSNLKSRESYGVVRGLVAVGLMAYKGAYNSVREVSTEVRKVLELLVGQINAKILGGKDRYRFLRLLSQVAYLEDMVNSWAYGLRSYELESQISASNAGPVIKGRVETEDDTRGGNFVGNDAYVPSISIESQQDVDLLGSEKGPTRHPHRADKFADLSDQDMDLNSPLDGSILRAGPSQETVSFSLHERCTSVGGSVFGNIIQDHTSASHGQCTVIQRESASLKQSNGLAVTSPKNGICNGVKSAVIVGSKVRKDSDRSNGSLTMEVPSANGDVNGAFIPDMVAQPANLGTLEESNSGIRDESSGSCCLYECCSECTSTICHLIQDILIDNWESTSYCSSVAEAHDIITACSVRLLAAVRKSLVAEGSINGGDFCDGDQECGTRDRHCACQDACSTHSLKSSCWHKSPGNRQIVPMECICHLKHKEVLSASKSGQNSLVGSVLKFFFRDDALVPSDHHKDAILHCKIETFCVCYIIGKISMIKQSAVR